MSSVATNHPSLYELFEWVTESREIFDPSRSESHVSSGCSECKDGVAFLEALGAMLEEDFQYDQYFEDLYPASATGEERRGALQRFVKGDEGVSAIDHAARLSELALPLAKRLLAAIEEGIEPLRGVLRTLDMNPARGYAVIYALELAARLVPKNPVRIREAARVFAEEARRYPVHRAGMGPPIVSRELVEGEAALLESQALTSLGRTTEAREKVRAARNAFAATGDVGFHEALCDYFEGSAASFHGDYAGADELLAKAAAGFREFRQEQWEGRAEAALATSISQRGDDRAAQPLYVRGLAKLDPVLDANAYIQALINKASSLAHLDEVSEAKRLYARALSMSLKQGTSQQAHMIRVGLAEIDFRRGEYEKALASYVKLARSAGEAGYEEDVLLARLCAAECLGRLGRDREMSEAVEALRLERGMPEGDPALLDLFSCLDRGDLEAGVVTHVREFLERAPEPEVYVPFPRRLGAR